MWMSFAVGCVACVCMCHTALFSHSFRTTTEGYDIGKEAESGGGRGAENSLDNFSACLSQ